MSKEKPAVPAQKILPEEKAPIPEGLKLGDKVTVKPNPDCIVVDENRIRYVTDKSKKVVITVQVLTQIKSGDLIVIVGDK